MDWCRHRTRRSDPTMTLTYGSLFAGVGGFDMGMDAAGWDCAWQVEWDKDCQQVLARHWPEVPRYGDVRNVAGGNIPLAGRPDNEPDSSGLVAVADGEQGARSVLVPVDCVIFGSPCQDLSVAGKRAGLDGHRSSLFFEATRIIKEMRHATHTQFPRWAIWENVAGALSSNKGADFAAVLGEMADLGAYLIEWHILDARWFGVPQRRRRVFVVACFDPSVAARCPDPLFPVASRSSWNPPAGDTAGQDVAGTLGGGTAVRRLTPQECEALQGWKPNHTRWRVDGTEQPDSTRYRQIGNGVATPVATWIAHHITKATL
jgi:DNA (cytosine-5)-methyltransferase 1